MKVRQNWGRRIIRHVFESPLVRLVKDHDYQDIYSQGWEYAGLMSKRPIVIYRFYPWVSKKENNNE